MNTIRLTFLIILTLSCTQSSNFSNIIFNFFGLKSATLGTVITCLTTSALKELTKNLTLTLNHPVIVLRLNQKNIYKSLKTNHHHIGVVLDGDCPKIAQFLVKCGQLKLFDVKHHWMITSSSMNITQTLENVVFNINTDLSIAVLEDETRTWSIFDVYNPASEHGGRLNITKIGSFSEKKGFEIVEIWPKYLSRRNMSGVTLKALVVLPVPFDGSLKDYLNSDENRDVNTFNRMHCRLVQFCQDFYNFTLDISVSTSWGYTNHDGSFDGMVGALERREIDLGCSPLFLRTDRGQVIDYGRNTWILRAAFIFRNPKSHTSFDVFLHPLSTSIWLITLLISTVAVVMFKAVTTFEHKQYHAVTETSWSLSLLFTLGAFCQQGSPSTPRFTCGRITTISIFLLSIIIYQFYSASLVSHLLMKPSTTIKNLRDLLNSPLKAGCEDILYDKDYFQHTTDEIAIELLNKKIVKTDNKSNFMSPEDGLVLVEQGGFAYHVETATAYPIIEATFRENAICELREMQLFKIQPMHANYQKDSPFRDLIDTIFQKMAEQGILQRERNHWHPRKPECIQSSKSTSFNVGLDEFYPALMGLLIGVLASLAVLVVEKQIKIFRVGVALSPLVYTVKNKPVLPYVH